ncbi:MAG: hypothetical protein IJ192_14925 [Clostridia bacterium]|nr:hypothetical protein [Clostridia bacterium]
MNFIDKAFRDGLYGDDFLQAMAEIYSYDEVRNELDKYPRFVKDVILILDYDTALQMDGLEDVLYGSLSEQFEEITEALKNAGADDEAELLKKAKALPESKLEEIYDGLALNSDYEKFWNSVRDYIDRSLIKKGA